MKNLSRAISPFIMALIILQACTPKTKSETKTVTPVDTVSSKKNPSSVTTAFYGTMKDGQRVTQYTLKNRHKLEMNVINYGGIITSLMVPDKDSVFEDVVLGFDSLHAYETKNPFFGALVGRYGNRIAKGKFSLDGTEYQLAVNDGANSLHGGRVGFDKVFWNIEIISDAADPSIKLVYTSKDGEEGYPGNVTVEVTYTLTEDDALRIDYTAQTDKKTVINLTQHTYFNLSGNAKRDILGHELILNADKFLPVDKGLIPTGAIKPVDKTPFDFRKSTAIGARINSSDPQIKTGGGYDHAWVFGDKGDDLKAGGSVYEPVSGRYMDLSTTQPAVQFYSGNFLDGSLKGKYGVVYAKRYGLCLETEHYPDSPNQKSFPSTELEPGKVFRSTTVYKFSVK